MSYNTSLPRSLLISFEHDSDFRWIYWAETILVVSGKRHISLKLIKLGLGVGWKKSTLKIDSENTLSSKKQVSET